MILKQKLFHILPYFLQNLLVTAVNWQQYRVRHGGKYRQYREYYQQVEGMDKSTLDKEISMKRVNFLNYVKNNSHWYRECDLLGDWESIPVLTKQDVINNLDVLKTIDEVDAIVSLTGGTTGASMKVLYTKNDMQERFAILDHFRAQYGYKLGKKTAWFSGKNLIQIDDLKNKRICSHYDFIHKIRFYSTFLINEDNFDVYWESLNEFSPEFLVGFPSSVYEICLIAQQRSLQYKGNVKVFFPTAETVLPIHRQVIKDVLGCHIANQYASSEGAPFILECKRGNLHIHPLTGIFEVVDEDFQPTQNGQLLVTSFTTHGTPLIRYQIGDGVELADDIERCSCGSLFPMVNSIQGRSTDYILSPEYGKINLGNISNSTKNIEGIICFQLVQKTIELVDLYLVVNSKFTDEQERRFILALRERIGNKITLNIQYLENIPKENSGKFRMVKNLLGM